MRKGRYNYSVSSYKDKGQEDGNCLSKEAIKKMLDMILRAKTMTQDELIKRLEISEVQLKKLICYKANPILLSKVNLPLIKIYCETKVDDV
ncbi:MAG: hypothetical protein KKE11_06130 [Gammaproteobacteria bacterium]|nr:hypothetical protein [Gammaproteobacteria bacterium]